MEWSILISIIGLVLSFIISWDARKTAKQKIADTDETLSAAEKLKSESIQALAEAEKARADAQKLQAEASQAQSQSVSILLDPLNARIKGLEGGMDALNEEAKTLRSEREMRETAHRAELASMRSNQEVMKLEVDELRLGVGILVIQLKEAGLEPRWYPKDKTGNSTRAVVD